MQNIIVGGRDKYNQLGVKPNNIIENFDPFISPPVKFSLDLSSLLSYSSYGNHSVLVTSDGSLKGIGSNLNGKISATLQKKEAEYFTDFCITDDSRNQLAAVSAVCYHPVSLFGGHSNSAAIGSEGEVIFIHRSSVSNSPNSPIPVASLPDGEKASSVACCETSVFVLSSNGRVFSSPIESNGVLNFSIVSELSDQEIVCLSGKCSHCLAVSKKGRVFGRGSNYDGKLGLGKRKESPWSFTEISSLFGYEIRAAYAGYDHSLFETREGKILSCGYNCYGELLISRKPNYEVYSPTETAINNGATFCIVGYSSSMVFIESTLPPNTPNMRIYEYK